MELLIDTNVVLDSFLEREPFVAVSRRNVKPAVMDDGQSACA